MKPNKASRLAGIVGLSSLALLLSSCAAATQLESTWSAPGIQPQPFSKVAIIATMRDSTESTGFENAAVARFQRAGVDAVPGFSILNGETKLDRAEMERRVEASGADAVLFFKVIAVDQENRYIEPTPYLVDGGLYPEWWDDRYWGYYNPYPFSYWGFWYPAVQVVGSPAYWGTYSTYQVESALYRVSDGKLVWDATSQTFDPSSQVDLGRSVAQPVIESLQDRGLIR